MVHFGCFGAQGMHWEEVQGWLPDLLFVPSHLPCQDRGGGPHSGAFLFGDPTAVLPALTTVELGLRLGFFVFCFFVCFFCFCLFCFFVFCFCVLFFYFIFLI